MPDAVYVLQSPSQVQSYGVTPTGYVCGEGGLIKLKMEPSGSRMRVTIKRCDDGTLNKAGEAWLGLGNRPKVWGPYSYNAGDSEISFNVDPVAERHFYTEGIYQAITSPLDQETTTTSETVRAWPVY